MSQFPYDSQSPYGYDSSQSANPYGYQQQPPMQNPYGPYAPGMPNPYAPWGSHPITGVPYSEKSKLVAGLLGIFLGYLGPDASTPATTVSPCVSSCSAGRRCSSGP